MIPSLQTKAESNVAAALCAAGGTTRGTVGLALGHVPFENEKAQISKTHDPVTCCPRAVVPAALPPDIHPRNIGRGRRP